MTLGGRCLVERIIRGPLMNPRGNEWCSICAGRILRVATGGGGYVERTRCLDILDSQEHGHAEVLAGVSLVSEWLERGVRAKRLIR